MLLGDRVIDLLSAFPAIRSARLAGSRADGRAHSKSDWDFLVETTDFPRLAAALPQLVEPLEPLAIQWERLGDTVCFMLILPGPVKVDLIFPAEPHEQKPPWRPSRANLVEIDRHFWDWMLWLSGKQAGGKNDLVETELTKLFDHLLAPLGAKAAPASIPEGVAMYRRLRDARERQFSVRVPRALEHAVASGL